MKVAFIGVGTMGWPIAAHIGKRHDIAVLNRSPEKAQAWHAENGGRVGSDVADTVREADVVLTCLPTDRDTEAVVLGEEGGFAAMRSGAVFVDLGSGAADCAGRLAQQAASHGIDYLDSPVTGGRVGAERGSLAALVGGEEAVLARVRPVLECFAADVRLMGPVGAGHITKMVNVIIGQINGLAVAEALGFAINAGLDPRTVVDVLMQGSSRSWILEHRSKAMIERDFRTLYPVSFARKDMGQTLAQGRSVGATMPVSALADQLYAAIEQRGYGDVDMASIIDFFVPPAGDGAN